MTTAIATTANCQHIRVQPLLVPTADYSDDDDWKTHIWEILYRLAFTLYVDYTLNPGEETSHFVYETDRESNHVNILYKVTNAFNDTYNAIEHYYQADKTRYLCSDVPIVEYHAIFGKNARVEDMYATVFKEVTKPKTFTSLVADAYDEKYNDLVIIPEMVLYMVERMIAEGMNYHWNHYFCINRTMFDEYKAAHTESQ